MSMLDTVHHAGLEWLTKSTVPRSGGMQGDFEVKDGRLWLKPWDVTDDDKPVDLPLEDFNFHGILELFRNLPRNEGGDKHSSQHLRLIFVDGRLLSETPAATDVENDFGWHGDYTPTDVIQRFVWQLHSVRGMLATINASSAMPSAAGQSIKQAETSIAEALSRLVTKTPEAETRFAVTKMGAGQ